MVTSPDACTKVNLQGRFTVAANHNRSRAVNDHLRGLHVDVAKAKPWQYALIPGAQITGGDRRVAFCPAGNACYGSILRMHAFRETAYGMERGGYRQSAGKGWHQRFARRYLGKGDFGGSLCTESPAQSEQWCCRIGGSRISLDRERSRSVVPSQRRRSTQPTSARERLLEIVTIGPSCVSPAPQLKRE